MIATALRPNKYAKSCVACNHRVEAGEGYLVPRRGDAGGWDVICKADAQDASGKPEMRQAIEQTSALPKPAPAFRKGVRDDHTPAEIAEDTANPSPLPVHHVSVRSRDGQMYMGLGSGTYTLESVHGHYRTFRVRVQGTDADFAPGKTVLEYLSGPDNESNYRSFAFVNRDRLQVWNRYASDPAHDGLLRDAREFLAHPARATAARHCIRCNALLTTPESLAAGIGPTCASKGW